MNREELAKVASRTEQARPNLSLLASQEENL
jgi:hypothetical protein